MWPLIPSKVGIIPSETSVNGGIEKYTYTINNLEIEYNPDEIIQGFYELRHLVLFSKCTNLCASIELYLKNDYPLIIEYMVASLGEIKLCLAPKVDS